MPDRATDPEEWLAAFHAGERPVLEACYRDHLATVAQAVGRVLEGADQETVIHDVFLRLLTDARMRAGFRDGAFPAWLTSSPDLPLHPGTWVDRTAEIFGQVGIEDGPPWAGAIWGSAPGDIYILGPEGGVLHFDGTSWSASMVQPDLTAIWGSGAKDVFAVGRAQGDLYTRSTSIWHFDGSGWSKMTASFVANLFSIWGSGPNDVFAVGTTLSGTGSAVLHFDGKTWVTMDTGLAVSLWNVWGRESGDVYCVGGNANFTGGISHYDGSTWKLVATELPRLQAVWGTGASHVYAAGAGSTLLHSTGASWTPPVLSSGVNTFNTIWGSGPADIYLGGDGGILHFDGTSWGKMKVISLTGSVVQAIWGSGPDDVWAVGDRIWHLQK